MKRELREHIYIYIYIGNEARFARSIIVFVSCGVARVGMAGQSALRPPDMDKHSFLFKDILHCDPQIALKFSLELQNKWTSEFTEDPELSKSMATWKKNKAIHLVSASDNFHKSPPDNLSTCDTYSLLSAPYDELMCKDHKLILDVEPPTDSDADDLQEDSDANRRSDRQLKQHLNAYFILMKSMHSGLSEDLIKQVHLTLMKNLSREGKNIHAGQYRRCAVYAGDHDFINYERIPSCMSKLIGKYDVKFKSENHHPFELAGWLLMEMLQIHPFEDGNGRLSRLLWCYSLQKDGLPFPVTPFPGLKKAYKNYIKCIDKDQDCVSPYKNMTSLTLISITRSWKNFLSNLRRENEEIFQIVARWLKESGNDVVFPL